MRTDLRRTFRPAPHLESEISEYGSRDQVTSLL